MGSRVSSQKRSPRRTVRASFPAYSSSTALSAVLTPVLSYCTSPSQAATSLVHLIVETRALNRRKTASFKLPCKRTSNEHLRQLHHAEVCIFSDQGKFRTPMRAITARHSLFPRSHTHLSNSFPCELPAIAKPLAWADNWAYHVPVLADSNAPEPVRLAPVSSPAAFVTTCSHFREEQPAAYLLVWA